MVSNNATPLPLPFPSSYKHHIQEHQQLSLPLLASPPDDVVTVAEEQHMPDPQHSGKVHGGTRDTEGHNASLTHTSSDCLLGASELHAR